MDEFLTWEMLLTYGGAVLATTLITQFFKGLGPIDKIPTRIFSYIVALIVMLAANFFVGVLTFETAALCVINAIIVSLAANGAYDAIAPEQKL